jgi:hypothetical protein
MPARVLPPDMWPAASPLIIAETSGYITIAIELPRAELARHLRFLEALVTAARTAPGEASHGPQ